MNPLHNPWAVKESPPKKGGKKVNPPFLGVRTELSKSAAQAQIYLTFEVRGLSAVPSGGYKIEYSEGASLRHYLHQLKLQHAATYSAIYDQSNLERGRCRMSYVPLSSSKILICNPTMGSAIRFQRSNVDAQRLTANMGRNGRGEAFHVVTKKLK